MEGIASQLPPIYSLRYAMRGMPSSRQALQCPFILSDTACYVLLLLYRSILLNRQMVMQALYPSFRTRVTTSIARW